MTTPDKVYLLADAFWAIQAWHMKNVHFGQLGGWSGNVRGTGEAIARWLYSAVGLLGRVNGFAYLVYRAFGERWTHAIWLWLVGMGIGLAANFTLRVTAGYAGIVLVAWAAVAVVPVAGVAMWILAL